MAVRVRPEKGAPGGRDAPALPATGGARGGDTASLPLPAPALHLLPQSRALLALARAGGVARLITLRNVTPP